VDLSVTNYTYNLPISRMDLVSLTPLVFTITGTGFMSARDVRINGSDVDRFEVINDGRLIVELPSTFTGTALTDVSIASSGPVAVSGDVSVSFSFSDNPASVRGISALTQRFLKLLLTTPGTSYENVDEGGGVRGMLGAVNGAELSTAHLTNAVSAVAQYMLEDPVFTSLPPGERLQAAEVLDTTWDRDTQTASIKITITNQLGETLESGVTV
jgi:hypothetical protein